MVTAIQWLSPQAICFILRPCNASIGRGVNKSLELLWPNLPKSPLKNYKKQKLLMIVHRSLTLLTPNWQINHGRKESSWWDGKHFRVARYRRQNIISSQTLDTMTFHTALWNAPKFSITQIKHDFRLSFTIIILYIVIREP